MNQMAIARWPLVEISAENQGAASASRTGGVRRIYPGKITFKGMNPLDIKVDRFPRAPQSTSPEGGPSRCGARAVSTSIKLQFGNACVDEARGQFIIRSISLLGCTHTIQSFPAAPVLRRVSRMDAGPHGMVFFFRDLTVTGAEWGPLAIQECGGGTACAPPCHYIFWVAEDALGRDVGVAVIVWG